MLNFDNHYKELKPEETIENITNFFTSKNLVIKELCWFPSEINTYSCRYGLFLDNKLILATNGKGMNKLFCKASCLSEMYERFCVANLCHPYDIKTRENLSSSIDSTILFNNIYQNIIFDQMLPSREYANELVSLLNLYSVEYTKLFTDEKEKYIPTLLGAALGSTGFAAGNTIEEALVQGISEVFERVVNQNFYLIPQDKYYFIDINILNDELQQKIQKIQELGYKCYIYDLSYNFSLPVCMILICNLQSHMFYSNFGSAPVFDIAVERCVTEIYQGIISIYQLNSKIDIKKNMNSIQTAFKQFITSKTEDIYIPEDLILKSQKINKYNNKIFIDNNNILSNNILLKQIQKICELNNLHFYWRDISLSNDIKAIHVITQEPILSPIVKYNWSLLESYSQQDKNNLYILFKDIIILFKKSINNLLTISDLALNITNIFSNEFFISYDIEKIINNPAIKRFSKFFDFGKCFPKDFNFFQLCYTLLFNFNTRCILSNNNNEDINIFNDVYNSHYLYQEYKKYNYDIDTIKKIFQFLNLSLPNNYDEDLYLSQSYILSIKLIKSIICDTIFQFYQSSFYNKYKEL